MKSKDIITICIALLALIISFIAIYWTQKWDKYTNYLKRKEFINNLLREYNNQFVKNIDSFNGILKNSFKSSNFDDHIFELENHFINSSVKNKVLLINILEFLLDFSVDNKFFFNNNIFHCINCNKFYKIKSLILLKNFITSPWFDMHIKSIFIKELYKQAFNKVSFNPFLNFLSQVQVFSLQQYDFNVKLYYYKYAKREFLINVINNFDEEKINKWLLEINENKISLNIFNKSKEYVKKLKDCITNDNFKKKIELEVKNTGWVDFSFKGKDSYFDLNFSYLRSILDLFLDDNYDPLKIINIKDLHNVVFSILKCHYCFLENWGLRSFMSYEKIVDFFEEEKTKNNRVDFKNKIYEMIKKIESEVKLKFSFNAYVKIKNFYYGFQQLDQALNNNSYVKQDINTSETTGEVLNKKTIKILKNKKPIEDLKKMLTEIKKELDINENFKELSTNFDKYIDEILKDYSMEN